MVNHTTINCQENIMLHIIGFILLMLFLWHVFTMTCKIAPRFGFFIGCLTCCFLPFIQWVAIPLMACFICYGFVKAIDKLIAYIFSGKIFIDIFSSVRSLAIELFTWVKKSLRALCVLALLVGSMTAFVVYADSHRPINKTYCSEKYKLNHAAECY